MGRAKIYQLVMDELEDHIQGTLCFSAKASPEESTEKV